MKKILITGAAGFIGSNLAKRLLAENFDVVGIDNLNDYYSVKLKEDRLNILLKNKLKNYQVNLEDDGKILEIVNQEKPDIIINLAAQAGVRYSLENPFAYIKSNINGFISIINAAKKVGCEHFIYASSSSVYGANESLPFKTSDNVDHPLSLYAATKKSNELIAHTYSHLYNMPTTGLRFFTVYGPWGRPDMALFKFTESILNKKEIDVFNYGNMLRDFTYVDDIVNAIIKLIDQPSFGNRDWDGKNPDPSSSKAPYKIFNIGNNSPVKLEDFIDAIEEKLQIRAIKNYMPLQPGDVPQTYANVEDLYEKISFRPQTKIQDGVSDFIDWYIEYYNYDVRSNW